MAGKRENLAPMWKELGVEGKGGLRLEPPMDSDKNIYLGCERRHCEVDVDEVIEKTEIFGRLFADEGKALKQEVDEKPLKALLRATKKTVLGRNSVAEPLRPSHNSDLDVKLKKANKAKKFAKKSLGSCEGEDDGASSDSSTNSNFSSTSISSKSLANPVKIKERKSHSILLQYERACSTIY